MSYSIDRSRAVSLSTHDGVWSLEVEELVRLNRNIFRPRRQRLSGREAILQHLAMNQQTLLMETQRLLDGPLGDDAFRFELRGSDWVPVPAMQLVQDTRRAAAEKEQALQLVDEVTELRSRMHEIEQSVNSIKDQVAQLLEKGVVIPAAPSGGQGGQGAPGASQPPPEAPHEGASPELQAVEASQVAEEPPAPPPPPDFPELKLPALEALLDMVKGLVGDEVGMKAVDLDTWNVSEDSSGYLVLLNDDKGKVVGAIAMDLEATVRLAGGMLMEDEEVLTAQIAEGSPSADVMETAGEVLNTLTSAVNKIKGNAHVRAGELQHINASEHPWLCYSRKRDDFALSVGGHLAVFAR